MLKIYHSLSDDSDEACTNILLGQQTATYAELMLQLKAKLQLNKADECKVFVQNQKTKEYCGCLGDLQDMTLLEAVTLLAKHKDSMRYVLLQRNEWKKLKVSHDVIERINRSNGKESLKKSNEQTNSLHKSNKDLSNHLKVAMESIPESQRSSASLVIAGEESSESSETTETESTESESTDDSSSRKRHRKRKHAKQRPSEQKNASAIARKALTLDTKSSAKHKDDTLSTTTGDTLITGSVAQHMSNSERERKAILLERKFGAKPPADQMERSNSDDAQKQQMLLAVRPNTSLMVHSADEDQFFDKCTQILSSIDGVPSTITSASVDSRRFVREGTMQKLSPSGAWQERHFFLFSDLLMWVKPKLLSRRYTYKGQIWLDGALLVVDPTDEKIPVNGFTLISGLPSMGSRLALSAQNNEEDIPKSKLYVLKTEDRAEKIYWTQALEYLINSLSEMRQQREEQKERIKDLLRQKPQLIQEEIAEIDADERRRAERREKRRAKRRERRRQRRIDGDKSPRSHASRRTKRKDISSSLMTQVSREK